MAGIIWQSRIRIWETQHSSSGLGYARLRRLVTGWWYYMPLYTAVLCECIYVTGTSHPWSWLVPTWSNRRELKLWWQPSANRTELLLLRHFFSIQLKGMKGRWQIHTGNKSKKNKRKSFQIFIFSHFSGIYRFDRWIRRGHGRRQRQPIGARVYMLDRCVTSATVAEHLARSSSADDKRWTLKIQLYAPWPRMMAAVMMVVFLSLGFFSPAVVPSSDVSQKEE